MHKPAAAAEPLEHLHTDAAIRERLGRDVRANYLRDWIYGGIDGTVTTFAIVAGAPKTTLIPTEVGIRRRPG